MWRHCNTLITLYVYLAIVIQKKIAEDREVYSQRRLYFLNQVPFTRVNHKIWDKQGKQTFSCKLIAF